MRMMMKLAMTVLEAMFKVMIFSPKAIIIEYLSNGTENEDVNGVQGNENKEDDT